MLRQAILRRGAVAAVSRRLEVRTLSTSKTVLEQGILRRGAVAAVARRLEVRTLHTFHTPDETMPEVARDGPPPPFFKLLAANRGEISTRILRAATELGISTAGIYSHEGTRICEPIHHWLTTLSIVY